MKKKPRFSITFRALQQGKVITEVVSTKYRRILEKIQRAKIPECTFFICVREGKQLDNFGKYSTFKNEGFYDTKEELLRTLRIFCENP